LRDKQIKAEEEAVAKKAALAAAGHASMTDQTVDFRNDPKEEMTYARRLALKWIYKKNWYRRIANGAADDIDSTNSRSDDQSVRSSAFAMMADDTEEKPSLARGWAYFEHVALDRYIVTEEEELELKAPKGFFGRVYQRFFAGERELRRAAPGTKDVKTRLFDPFNTPHSQVRDFSASPDVLLCRKTCSPCAISCVL
jgi:hypothetical protein